MCGEVREVITWNKPTSKLTKDWGKYFVIYNLRSDKILYAQVYLRSRQLYRIKTSLSTQTRSYLCQKKETFTINANETETKVILIAAEKFVISVELETHLPLILFTLFIPRSQIFNCRYLFSCKPNMVNYVDALIYRRSKKINDKWITT